MLKINVGLSRKITEDYNSRGFSLNLEGELPSDLLNDSNALNQCTERIFQIATQLLDEQVRQASQPKQSAKPAARPLSQPATNGRQLYIQNGHNRQQSPIQQNQQTSDNGQRQPNNGQRLLTQAQARAIQNMTRKLNYNADAWSMEEFGAQVNSLTVKQASEAIDTLKQSLTGLGVM